MKIAFFDWYFGRIRINRSSRSIGTHSDDKRSAVMLFRKIEMLIRRFMGNYKKAWETSDEHLLASLFTEDGRYHNTLFAVQTGHAQIKRYWQRTKLQADTRQSMGQSKRQHSNSQNRLLRGATAGSNQAASTLVVCPQD